MSIMLTLNEINREAYEVLYKELGVSKTLRFLSQFSLGRGDYTHLKSELYKGKTVSDLVREIEKSKT